MYHSVIPVPKGHNPIVVEGRLPTQLLIFNAGPSDIEALVWNEWNGKVDNSYSRNSEEPNLRLELRAGNQKIVSGSFVRLKLKNVGTINENEFSAVGVRIIYDYINPLL